MRVLKPGGRLLVRTAFLQPQHEAPLHFHNCTKYGLMEWFDSFEIECWVSENFHAGYSISWLASECEGALRQFVSDEAADRLLAASVGKIVSYWRSAEGRQRTDEPIWNDLAALPQSAQEVVAADFEYLGNL